VSISAVKCSRVKCGEEYVAKCLQCSDGANNKVTLLEDT
jgi:hypothetical protein